ncbi:MAG TPA: hypothetical protein VK675_01860 [Candidatus Paceibacterota bacterium]|nr:hypothetical protein [Candidatus Paceibacterota bacterium]
MKNSQKGFIVPLLIVIIAILVIGFGVYVYNNKKVSEKEILDGKIAEECSKGGNGPKEISQECGNLLAEKRLKYPEEFPSGVNKTNLITQPSTQPDETSNWKTYTNDQYNLSIKYPVDFSINESKGGGFFNEQNLYDLSISAPADYQKNTDFNIGRIEILVSPSIAKCYTSSSNGGNLSSIKLINGISFYYNPQQPFEDDAMGGQRGKDSLFASIHDNQCYRIQKFVGYRDARGFTNPPYPQHFDEQKVNTDLDNIISTFKFTK